MTIVRGVRECNARWCWLCFHVGTVVIYIGSGMSYGHRIEIATPHRWFRFTKGAK